MSIEIEELAEAVDAGLVGNGPSAVRLDEKPPADPTRGLAIIVPATLVRAAAAASMLVPRLIADAGEHASLRFLDFFTANIRNPNTRAAYAVAVRAFFSWLDANVAPLAAVRTHHVSAYVEFLGRRYRAPTVKQHLAAIRMLFDWLIVGQIFAGPNPPPRCAARSTSSRKARPPCSTATRRKSCSTVLMSRRSSDCATAR